MPMNPVLLMQHPQRARHNINSRIRACLLACLAVLGLPMLLCGCETMDRIGEYRNPRVEFPPAPTLPQAAPVAASFSSAGMPGTVSISPGGAPGAIYQPLAYRPLFEDHRARLPGDSLIITIVEKISASQSSGSTVEQAGKLNGSISAVPLLPSTLFSRGSAQGSSANTYDGKGSTKSSNDFSGIITAVVTGLLPNGHLMIMAEKQIGLNSNVDVLRFSGQVDPRAIQPGNVVVSTSVANVRLEQRSRGQQADVQAMGWLSRVFLSLSPI